jgi:D-alanyl-D-alanine carboxypeptidase
MRAGYCGGAILAVLVAVAPARAAPKLPTLPAKLQRLIDDYVARRGAIEGFSGVALRVDRGPSARQLVMYAGDNGLPDKQRLGPRTLFQIGSNTKLFTAVLVLKLEAEGKLSIDDTVGKFLPHYPAWKNVTIRSLLDMTSGLRNYSETVAIGRIVAADLQHQFSNADLLAAVYPGTGLPEPATWFYSNTNNIVAALIIERVTGLSFKDALRRYILDPLRLGDTVYPDGATPSEVVARLPRGLYLNAACQLYQPAPCTKPVLGPVVGKDMRTQNLSWAGAAGAMIATPRNMETWLRALFGGRVIPARQMAEMERLVSMADGKPVADVSAGVPRAFGLDVAKVYDPAVGQAFWFYQGETMGYRVVFAYYPHADLLIIGGTNSQAPEGQDDFGKVVVGGAAAIALREAAGK